MLNTIPDKELRLTGYPEYLLCFFISELNHVASVMSSGMTFQESDAVQIFLVCRLWGSGLTMECSVEEIFEFQCGEKGRKGKLVV